MSNLIKLHIFRDKNKNKKIHTEHKMLLLVHDLNLFINIQPLFTFSLCSTYINLL